MPDIEELVIQDPEELEKRLEEQRLQQEEQELESTQEALRRGLLIRKGLRIPIVKEKLGPFVEPIVFLTRAGSIGLKATQIPGMEYTQAPEWVKQGSIKEAFLSGFYDELNAIGNHLDKK